MTLQRFDLQELPATPWKNGGGLSTEIVRGPLSGPDANGMHGTEASDWLWRVSVACIASDGPFSRFDGIERQILLLSGAGVLLHQGSVPLHRLDTPLQPYAFAGETAIEATRLDTAPQASSLDLNVMTRRGAAAAHIEIHRQACAIRPGASGLLLCWSLRPRAQAAQALWQIEASATTASSPRQSLSLQHGQGLHWTHSPAPLSAVGWPAQPLADGCALVQVCIHNADAAAHQRRDG